MGEFLPVRLSSKSATVLSVSSLCLNNDNSPLYMPTSSNVKGLIVCMTLYVLPGAVSSLLCMSWSHKTNRSSPRLLPVRCCSLPPSVRALMASESSPHFHVFTLCTGDVSCWCVHRLHWSAVFMWPRVSLDSFTGKKIRDSFIVVPIKDAAWPTSHC